MPSTACWWLLGSEGKHCECLGCDLSTPDVTSGSKKTSGGLSGLSYKPGGKNLPQGVEIPWLCLCCAAGNEGLGAGPFMVLKNEMVSGQLRFWGGKWQLLGWRTKRHICSIRNSREISEQGDFGSREEAQGEASRIQGWKQDKPSRFWTVKPPGWQHVPGLGSKS